MFRFGLLRFFLSLLILGGLVAGGVALYRAGWDSGYQTALLSAPAATDGAQAAPRLPAYSYVPYYYPSYGPAGFFNPFGWVFCIGGFLLVLFIFGGLFRFIGWRRWAHRSGTAGPNNPEGFYGPYGWHHWRQGPPPAPGQPKETPPGTQEH